MASIEEELALARLAKAAIEGKLMKGAIEYYARPISRQQGNQTFLVLGMFVITLELRFLL